VGDASGAAPAAETGSGGAETGAGGAETGTGGAETDAGGDETGAGDDETAPEDAAGGAGVCRPASAPSKSKPKSKSKSGSSGGSTGSVGVPVPDVVPEAAVPEAAVPEAGAAPKRSRNGESMSSGSTGGVPLVRGRIGWGAWKTATAPWPGPGNCSTVSSGE
jgi:hypothetical protein